MNLKKKFEIYEKNTSPWNRTYFSKKDKYFYPNSVRELIEFRRSLKKNSLKYIIKTGNCSYDSKSMPSDKNTYIISLKNFNKIIKIDKTKGTVIVQSGTKISNLVKTLKINRYKIFCVPGGEKISVGGAISANAIGKDSSPVFGSFGDNVISLKILTSKNKIMHLSKSSIKFKNIIGGFGLNGLILEAKLKIKKIKTENVKLETKIVSNLFELKKALQKKFEYNYAQLDPFFRKSNFGIIFSARTSDINRYIYQNINLKSSYIEEKIFKFSSLFLNRFTWKIFYKLFFFLNKNQKKIIDLHNFHYSSKYKHMIPLIHKTGIHDYELLIKGNFINVMKDIIKFLSERKIFCIYIVIKKIFRSKSKYFYKFNDNGFAVALSIRNDSASEDFYKFLLKVIQKYNIKLNLSKTDKILLGKKINKDKLFMSLYKLMVNKNGKISRKRT